MLTARGLPACVLACLLCLGLWSQHPSPARADEIEISTDIDGAIGMARRALAIGRPDVAASIARQILAQAPGDAGAHMILAAALTRSGEAGQAVTAARRGFSLAEGDEARFEGAWLTAEALAAAGHSWRARFWLRRADAFAPSRAHEAALARAYGSLAAQSRLSFGLQVFAGPSENVNGGSLHDTFWFMGIPIPVDQALPGFVWGGALSAAWRLSPETALTARLARREVTLGDRAHAIDPTARSSDFGQDELAIGARHVWQDAAGRTAILLGAEAGRRWQGGRRNVDLLSASAELRRTTGPDDVVALRYGVESATVRGRPVADSVTHRAGASASHRADWLGAVTLGLDAVFVDSDAAGIAWRGPSLSLAWRAPIDGDRLGLLLDVSYERRDYWQTPDFAPDKALGIALTAELPTLSVMGFDPTVTVSLTRTHSQVVVRDTREMGVSFGLSSRF